MFAERVLEQDTPSARTARRLDEWSPETEMLTNIYDRLGEQISVAMAVAGARKPARPTPAPRPRTAVDRVRQRRRELESRRLSAKLLPATS